MGKVLKFPVEKVRQARSEAEAKQKWEAIPPNIRTLLLRNAFCKCCKGATTIDKHRVSVEGDLLVIDGVCTECGDAVRRVVE